MPTFTNFYETVKEADMRLRYTMVMYEGEPYYVLCIANHKPDGIFRIYLDKAGNPDGFLHQLETVPYGNSQDPALNAIALDAWLDKNPDKGIIRRMMNSPAFNKFRPFPLGMVNLAGQVVYTERKPVRHTQQGLSDNMLKQTKLSISPPVAHLKPMGGYVSMFSTSLYRTIMGQYPSPYDCIQRLREPLNGNEGVAFDRQFALMKGPIDTLLLAYKEEIVGILPEGDFSYIRLGEKFRHTKEVIENLNLFDVVEVK